MQPEPGKCFHAERQQRFADVKPRKFFAFEYDHAPPGAGEERRSRAAGRATADDSDIVNRFRHAAINLPTLGRKQTLEANDRQSSESRRLPAAPGRPGTPYWLEMVAVDPSILVRLMVNFSA